MVKKIAYIFYFALSAVLLTLIQQPYNVSFLAWIAFVPFVLAALSNKPLNGFLDSVPINRDSARNDKSALIWSYTIGLSYWLINLYWLIPITIPGWLSVCFYLAVYWPIVVIALRFCQKKNIPLWFSLPILIVGEETLRGWLFSWRFLAHSQFENISLIQIADTFGTAGVSFIIAMVNGVICEIIFDLKYHLAPATCGGVRPPRAAAAKYISIIFTISILTVTLFYGRYRINQTPGFIEAGPKIGVVQSNVPVIAAKDTEPFEQIFLNQLAASRDALMQAAPSLIIWPETIIETVLDDSYLKLVGDGYASKIIHNALLQHSNEGMYLLVGAFAGDANQTDEGIKFKTKYNTAFLYEPNQTGPRQHFNKIHLVPFGEYLPLKKELPFLYKFLLSLTPYDYDYTLTPGNKYTIFKMRQENRTYHFGVSICYEDAVAAICRRLAVDKNGNKQADWLVNISNDGWFVTKKGDKIKVSPELSQHMAICVFRAIENRLSVIRCANTGISCLIDSVGNIKNNYSAGTLEKKVSQRTGQAGWFVDTILIDKRVTAFSKYGQLLDISCAICFILAAAMSIIDSRAIGRQKKSEKENK